MVLEGKRGEMTEDKIREHALAFRKTIQLMPLNEFPNSSFFENFPRGCCGDTSHLFAKFLSNKGIQAHYVWGIDKEGRSHAWLEHNCVIIDLTADQFPDIHEEVIVTRNGQWYEQFTIQGKYLSDFEMFNDFNAIRLGQIFSNIMSRKE
ncbi:transglutaminase domain-containing protein [Paenibacillus sp. HJGM_3]|uniref:transglutaminase domain-containing protein n=1 Tax=Paenibacillus sp. HJGM_3 TaxID=3379816 RepID=UPI00385A3861